MYFPKVVLVAIGIYFIGLMIIPLVANSNPTSSFIPVSCIPTSDLMDNLNSEQTMKSVRGVSIGVVEGGKSVIKTYFNKDLGKFYVYIHNLNGMSCLIARGDQFELDQDIFEPNKEEM